MDWESFVLLNRGISNRRALGTRAGMMLVMLLLLSMGSSANRVHAKSGAGTPSPSSHLLFLPVVARRAKPNKFPNTQAIWPHAEKPAAHEVALFRHTFSLAEPLP